MYTYHISLHINLYIFKPFNLGMFSLGFLEVKVPGKTLDIWEAPDGSTKRQKPPLPKRLLGLRNHLLTFWAPLTLSSQRGSEVRA